MLGYSFENLWEKSFWTTLCNNRKLDIILCIFILIYTGISVCSDGAQLFPTLSNVNTEVQYLAWFAEDTSVTQVLRLSHTHPSTFEFNK